MATIYGFTGEMRDYANHLVYLRARHYNASLGLFMSLDPWEGMRDRPMSLNGYSWVEGNVPNAVDASGMQAEDDLRLLNGLAGCSQSDPCSVYPGWRGSLSLGNTVQACSNDRTLYPGTSVGQGSPSISGLQTWWAGLSTTAREIEVALALTGMEDCRYRAEFDHLPENTFDSVSRWISSNRALIEQVSAKVRVQPALVAGILASEMLFDYGINDQLSDSNPYIAMITGLSPNQGFGYSNAHLSARIASYEYLQPLIDKGAVEPVPTRLIMGNDVTTAYWLTQAEGAIWATAVVARWLVDPFMNNTGSNYGTALKLSPEQMGVIWSGYRAGVAGWSPPPPPGEYLGFENVRQWQDSVKQTLPCNAQLSLPVMKYMNVLFP